MSREDFQELRTSVKAMQEKFLNISQALASVPALGDRGLISSQDPAEVIPVLELVEETPDAPEI